MREGLNDENKSRLFILFLMKNLEQPADLDGLFNLAMECGINYFEFYDILSRHLSDGNLALEEAGNPPRYTLTPRGREIADNLIHLLPIELRERGYAAAVRVRSLSEGGFVYECSLEREGESFRFICGARCGSQRLMELTIYIGEEATARAVEATFKSRPEVVYKGIYAMLTGNVKFLFW